MHAPGSDILPVVLVLYYSRRSVLRVFEHSHAKGPMQVVLCIMHYAPLTVFLEEAILLRHSTRENAVEGVNGWITSIV